MEGVGVSSGRIDNRMDRSLHVKDGKLMVYNSKKIKTNLGQLFNIIE